MFFVFCFDIIMYFFKCCYIIFCKCNVYIHPLLHHYVFLQMLIFIFKKTTTTLNIMFTYIFFYIIMYFLKCCYIIFCKYNIYIHVHPLKKKCTMCVVFLMLPICVNIITYLILTVCIKTVCCLEVVYLCPLHAR